jgi:sarcosine oxidase
MPRHDVIVVGLGAMGSAAAHHLARRGARVLGLDRFAPPHAQGSSHGKSRIIREAYFEDPLYVPLVRRAYELWAALERESGREILVRTGGLMLGPPDGVVVPGALRSAREHGLPHEALDAREVRRRVPGFRPAADMAGVWEPRAGYLVPEAAVAAHLALAARDGAELRADEPALAWRATADGVEVTTGRGTYAADRLVLAAGAWMPALLGPSGAPLAVERTVLYWFRPERPTGLFDRARFPVFICEYAPGLAWYGFPDAGDGVKVGLHHHGSAPTPTRCAHRGAGGGRRRPRAAARVHAGGGRAPRRRRGVHVHQHPGRALRRRPPPRAPAGGRREPVLGPRLQVRERRRRAARGPRARRAAGRRPHAVPPRPPSPRPRPRA